MSNKKKTGDKLVASIRKSKSGTVAQKTAERPGVAKIKKSTAGTSTSKKASVASETQVSNNSFSRGRRVWPD